MRVRLSLLLAAAFAGCSGPSVRGTPDHGTTVEEIIAAFAAAAAADAERYRGWSDGPAPGPPPELSKIGIVDGSWSNIADEALAAAIEEYARESGTAVELCPKTYVCSGRPLWGVFGFTTGAPFLGETINVSMRFPREQPTPHYIGGTVYSAEVAVLESGGWRVGRPEATGWMGS